MITGLDLNQTVDYILKNDTENPTTWKLGVIPSYLFAKVSGEATDDKIGTAFKLLQISLKGWENYSVPYSTKKETIFGKEMEVVPIEVLETIPIGVINELAVKIIEINQLSEIERKN